MKNIFFLLSALILLGCSGPEQKIETIEISDGVFYGQNICDNCDYSKWVVVLNKDQTFNLTQRKMRTFETLKVEKGTWVQEGNNISLTADNGSNYSAIIENKNYISFAINDYQNIKMGTMLSPSAEATKTALEGFDAYGLGKGRNWSFRILVKNKIVLNHPALGENFELPYNKPTPDYKLHSYTWTWNVNGSEIELVITDSPCDNGMPASATISVNGAMREACVNYVNPNFLLQNIWQLNKFRGEELEPLRFTRGIPVLEIDALNVVAMGHTGCNIWNGGLKIQNGKIIVMPGPMTNAICGWPEFERDYIQTLGQPLDYEYTGDKLLLSVDDVVIYEYVKFKGGQTDITEDEN